MYITLTIYYIGILLSRKTGVLLHFKFSSLKYSIKSTAPIDGETKSISYNIMIVKKYRTSKFVSILRINCLHKLHL